MSVSDWTAGKIQPNAESIYLICKAFNVSADYVTLYEIDDNGKKKEIERTRYLHGECVYKTIRGKCVISSVDKEKRA